MSESPTSTLPKGRLPIWVSAVGVLALLILAISFGGFVYWLLFRPSAAPVSSQPVSSKPASFVEIFNGRDLTGWDFSPEVWTVRDGVIAGDEQRSGAGRALFWGEGEVADFELRFHFRLMEGNCGVNYRSTRLADFDVGGYEFEIYSNKTGNLANVGSDRERYRLHRAPSTAEPLDSEWHEGVIIANGKRLIHMLDGKTLCDVTDTNPAAPKTGVIAFNIGTGALIEFKEIRLKRLNSEGK